MSEAVREALNVHLCHWADTLMLGDLSDKLQKWFRIVCEITSDQQMASIQFGARKEMLSVQTEETLLVQ